MPTQTQPLTDIVSVTVMVGPAPAGPPALDVGLIVGPSAVIDPATRTQTYASTAAMLTGGWAGTEPEYLAAELYFGQSPAPQSVVIGRQNIDAQSSTTLSSALVEGTEYTALTVAALTVAIEKGATVTVGTGDTTQECVASAAAASGATSISVESFIANAAYATDIAVATDTPESILEAVEACQASTTSWYAFYCVGTADADVLAVAAWADAAVPGVAYFYDTDDPDVENGVADNLMAQMQSAKYHRSFGLWSATEYAGAALMGVAMGLAVGLANDLVNSAFTLAYKTLAGVTADSFSATQFQNITGYKGNVFTGFGTQYTLLAYGTAADGGWFDDLLNLDNLSADIGTNVLDAITGAATKIPMSDDGVTMLVDAVTSACDEAYQEDVLGTATWNGSPVLNLATGATLPNGYSVQAAAVSTLTPEQVAARQAPPIYACVALAGAIQQASIGVIVQL